MKILVCIKQVPDDSVEIALDRNGKPAIDDVTPVVNAFDTYALEMAARLKEERNDGSEITVLCIGPESAKNSLKNCLAVGADEAYHVNDAGIEETDALGTAKLLKEAIAKLEAEKGAFSLIFTGKEATDITLGQTGIYLAKQLDVPVVTDVLAVDVKEERILANHETDEGYQVTEASLPAVLTVSKPNYDPRYPTIKNKMAARRKPIGELDLSEFASAFPAKLTTISDYEPPKREAGVLIREETAEESTEAAIRMMLDARVL